MKKMIIVSSALLLIMTQTRASNDSLTNDGVNSKKNAPVVRNILSDKLPAKLLTSIKKNYKSYWITELYKETANGKASYHITLENADQRVVLSANPSTAWVVKKTVPKDALAF